MGIVGYTYDEVNAMPMEAIERAVNARMKFVNNILRACFGEGEPPAPEPKATRPLSPKLFDALFG